MQNDYDFYKDFESVKSEFPRLKLKVDNGVKSISGLLSVRNPETLKIVAHFNVLLKFPITFPFCYPKVYETGGFFPKNDVDNYHINGDGTLCLDVEISEIIKAKKGLSLLDFIHQILIPNLFWRYCVYHEIPFKRTEWDHYEKGILQAYSYWLEENNPTYLLKTILAFLELKSFPRNARCFCRKVDSKKRFKHCHERKNNILHVIGQEQVLKDYKRIKDLLKDSQA